MHLSFSLDALGGVPTPQIGGAAPGLRFVNHPRRPAGSLYSGQDAPRSGQDAFKSAIIASKIPVKRLSDAFSVDDAIRNAI